MVPGRLRILKTSETFNVLVSDFSGLVADLMTPAEPERRQLQPGQVVCRSHESYEEWQAKGYDGEPFRIIIKPKK